jgi:hypothetical protein
MKPQIVIRAGNRFTICEKNILPYMTKNIDLIISAVSKACTELKTSPEKFEGSNQSKLNKLNDRVYEILTDWKVYKG